MSVLPNENLLKRLVRSDANSDLWATVAATCPAADPDEAAEPESDPKLRALLERINGMAGTRPPEVGSQDSGPEEDSTSDDFTPPEPSSLWEAGVTESEVESLILKFLLARGDAAGREIADQIKLPFVLVDELLRRMKNEQLVVLPRVGADERLRVPAHATWAASGPGGTRRTLHLLRRGAGVAGRLHRQRQGPVAAPTSIRREPTCAAPSRTC